MPGAFFHLVRVVLLGQRPFLELGEALQLLGLLQPAHLFLVKIGELSFRLQVFVERFLIVDEAVEGRIRNKTDEVVLYAFLRRCRFILPDGVLLLIELDRAIEAHDGVLQAHQLRAFHRQFSLQLLAGGDYLLEAMRTGFTRRFPTVWSWRCSVACRTPAGGRGHVEERHDRIGWRGRSGRRMRRWKRRIASRIGLAAGRSCDRSHRGP